MKTTHDAEDLKEMLKALDFMKTLTPESSVSSFTSELMAQLL